MTDSRWHLRIEGQELAFHFEHLLFVNLIKLSKGTSVYVYLLVFINLFVWVTVLTWIALVCDFEVLGGFGTRVLTKSVSAGCEVTFSLVLTLVKQYLKS